ncbi:unnamed protein product [[Actinomadura] parvosata subsp. kistnae]|uniref:Uncharacterized protein n=1 Tax=[Actinomadura] parvosata subsp. kistnae TaxID=1909395 RepID=A0A1V0A4N7_9ACTN|nr:hypothetical protein BKM31_30285 [Nonomuraea sp. ATCC 55076]SPL96450.1 unnamed protein product [Actinomadura parvosata subsp. kistnae]
MPVGLIGLCPGFWPKVSWLRSSSHSLKARSACGMVSAALVAEGVGVAEDGAGDGAAGVRVGGAAGQAGSPGTVPQPETPMTAASTPAAISKAPRIGSRTPVITEKNISDS